MKYSKQLVTQEKANKYDTTLRSLNKHPPAYFFLGGICPENYRKYDPILTFLKKKSNLSEHFALISLQCILDPLIFPYVITFLKITSNPPSTYSPNPVIRDSRGAA